jgi:hypothetical protein
MTRRGSRNPLLWNYAADYAINPILNAESDANFAWPKNPDGTRMGLFEEKYEGMRAEDIYDDIIKDQQKQKELENLSKNTNFGEVTDADQDLGEPDSDSSVAQEVYMDEEGEEQKPSKPTPGGQQPGEEGEDGEKQPGSGGQPGEKSDGEPEGEDPYSIIGKKVRVTEGPNAGQIGTVKQVLPNGDIIIE